MYYLNTFTTARHKKYLLTYQLKLYIDNVYIKKNVFPGYGFVNETPAREAATCSFLYIVKLS